MTGRKAAQIENARGRSLWRLNLDDLVVQPAVASSGYPSGEPTAFAAAPSSGCAVFKNLRLAPTALDSGSTGGRLPRLGSAWSRSARPVANPRLASVVARFRSPDGDPSGLRRTIPPPARPTINCRLAPDFDPSARLVEQPPAFAGCCRSFACASAAAAPAFTGCCLLLPNRRRTSDSHRLFHLRLHRFRFTRLAPGVSTSGWAFDAPLTSTEPCIGSKLPMSIQYPPVRASSGSASFDNFRLASALCNLWRGQRSLSGFRPRFHPLTGLAAIFRFSSAFRSTNRSGDQLPMPHRAIS